MILALTPLVEPLSIDEAFMDLSGTESLHRASAAETLTGLARRVEKELSITVSIGLIYNKFLAKIASDLDKPRGFAVIGRAEARSFLADKPVGLLWGVGEAMRRRLGRDGITLIGELARLDEAEPVARYGKIGKRLYLWARGEDDRHPRSPSGQADAVGGGDVPCGRAASRPWSQRTRLPPDRHRRPRLGWGQGSRNRRSACRFGIRACSSFAA